MLVKKYGCECSERIAAKINSPKMSAEIKQFFEDGVKSGVFTASAPMKPFYRYNDEKTFADVWYRCNVCGCLWEVCYPDFPALGFVRKFPDGKYFET